MCCGWIRAGNGFWMWGMSKCRACRPPSVEPGPSLPWQLRYYSWEHLLGTFFEHILSIILEHLLGITFRLILNTIWEFLLGIICIKGEWLLECPLDRVNCFLDSLVSIFNPGLKQPQKCLVSWKSDSSGGGGVAWQSLPVARRSRQSGKRQWELTMVALWPYIVPHCPHCGEEERR